MSYTIQRQVRLDQVTADALKALADKRGETVSDTIRRAIKAEITVLQYRYDPAIMDFMNRFNDTILNHRNYGATK